MAQKLLTALLSANYDMLKPSGVEMHGFDFVNSFEMLLMSSVDPEFFKQIANHIWVTQQSRFIELIDQIIQNKGRFVFIMIDARKDLRDQYLEHLQHILNDNMDLIQSILEKKYFEKQNEVMRQIDR